MTTAHNLEMYLTALDSPDLTIASFAALDLLTAAGRLLRRDDPSVITAAASRCREAIIREAIDRLDVALTKVLVDELVVTATRPDRDDEGKVLEMLPVGALASIAERVAIGRDDLESIRTALRWLDDNHIHVGVTDQDRERIDHDLAGLDQTAARWTHLLIAANPVRRELVEGLSVDKMKVWWLRRTECPRDVLDDAPWSPAARTHAQTCADCMADLRRRQAIASLLDVPIALHRSPPHTLGGRVSKELDDVVARLGAATPSKQLRALWSATSGSAADLELVFARTIARTLAPVIGLAAGAEAGMKIQGTIHGRPASGRLFVDDESITRETLFTLQIEGFQFTRGQAVQLRLGPHLFATGSFDTPSLVALRLVPTVAEQLAGGERFVGEAEIAMLEFVIP